jgi:FAD synthetase
MKFVSAFEDMHLKYKFISSIPSVFLLFISSVGMTQGFYVEQVLRMTNHGRQPEMASTPSSADSKIENWTTLPIPQAKDSVHYRNILDKRSSWSDNAYNESLDFYEQLVQCTDSYVSGPIQTALSCLDHSFRLYGPKSVICSFNGGKDAVVILHLLRAAYAAYCKQHVDNNNLVIQPRVVYFDHADEFPEILSFLHEQVADLDLNMICFQQGTKFQDGLKVIVDNNCAVESSSNDSVKIPIACVLGTRLTDPNAAGQQQFAPSSHYMPPFMRVNPILDWTYGNVWHFLRLFQLPYCCLYDQGYTSLGTTKDTLPCPSLAVAGIQNSSDNTSLPKYWPAYMLRDWDLERAGRITKQKKGTQATALSLGRETTATTPPSVSPSSSNEQLSTMSEGNFGTSSQQNRADSPCTSVKTSDVEGGEASCNSYMGDTITQKTAGLLIIGDEILKGFASDTNSQVAATALRENNVVLKYVVVVSDAKQDIIEEIRRMQKLVDVVITSGGVGGTHDDVTIESVAAALNCEMAKHDEMAQLLLKKMNKGGDTTSLSEAQAKMANLPTVAKLRYLSKDPDDWPILQCKSIFILPGVPEFFSRKIQNVAEYLSCQLDRLPAYKVVLQVDENSIVSILNRVVTNHPKIVFGSYPFVSHPEYKTVITVEGRLSSGNGIGRRNSSFCDPSMIDSSHVSDADVQMALDELVNMLPKDSVLRVDIDDMRLFS